MPWPLSTCCSAPRYPERQLRMMHHCRHCHRKTLAKSLFLYRSGKTKATQQTPTLLNLGPPGGCLPAHLRVALCAPRSLTHSGAATALRMTISGFSLHLPHKWERRRGSRAERPDSLSCLPATLKLFSSPWLSEKAARTSTCFSSSEAPPEWQS